MQDHIYLNKNAVNAALGIIRTMNKVAKIQEQEQTRF